VKPDRGAINMPGTAAVPWHRQKSLPTVILCALLLSVQLIPPLPQYVGLAPSMAAGMVIASGMCIVILSIFWALSRSNCGEGVLDAGAGGLILILAIVTLVTLHGVVADQIENLDRGRFVASLIPLILLLAGALAVSSAIRAAEPAQMELAIRVSYRVLWLVIALKLARLQPVGYAKSTFPFTETSHFALAFGPVFLYRCASARPERRTLWVLLGFALALGLKSGSLLAIAFVGAMLGRRFLLVGILGSAVAVAGLAVQFQYFAGRVALSDSSNNVSALVYLEGWEMLDSSLTRSHGWGEGFQQLGLQGSDVGAAEAIRHLTNGRDLNLQDGSFVLSKLGSEFGVLGLAIVAAYCLLALRCFRALRAGRASPNLNFARSVVVAYGVDMFVRGTGYFTESTLLFVAAVLVLAPEGGLLRAGRGPNLQKLMVLR
jgi:hypothetical protein